MKKLTLQVAAFLLGLLVMSCAKDRKEETISNYVRYMWKVPADQTVPLLKLVKVKDVVGKDSLELAIHEYWKDASPAPSVDTLLSRIEKDIAYNTNMVQKTQQRIDSVNKIAPTIKDQEFFKQYLKSFMDVKSFTEQQLNELNYIHYQIKRYSSKPEEVLATQYTCSFRVRKAAADTVTKIVEQNFWISPDTRRVMAVR